MSVTHYFYLQLSLPDLQQIVESHKTEFDLLLGDTFDPPELLKFEPMIDAIAAVYVQPILSELSFEDFYADAALEADQRNFFHSCRSAILLENLPYLESNPFQVSYLLMLLERFKEGLIDTGGINELQFKGPYLQHLKKFKTMESLIISSPVRVAPVKTSLPVEPIDFLIEDVYQQIKRLSSADDMKQVAAAMETQPEKIKKIFYTMLTEKLDAGTLFRMIGQNAKEFDDNLERLKFFLKKIP